MGTERPRHMITVTDEVAKALEEAAQRWPEKRDHPSELLRRLIQVGYTALHDDRRARQAAIRAAAGAATGVYGDRYLEKLREDWPA